MKKLLILSALLLSAFSIAVASVEWTTHLAYNSVRQVLITPDEVYVLSGGSIYSLDKQTNEIHTFSLQDGISASPIVRMYYDDASSTIVLFHQNGMIDFMQDGHLSSVSDLYLEVMTAGKGVNAVCGEGDLLYLSMPYGIQTFRLSTRTFENTYYIGDSASDVNVIGICKVGQMMYVASDSLVYVAPLSGNLVDYRNWTALPVVNGARPAGIVEKGGAPWVIWGQKLYRWNGAGWMPEFQDLSFKSIQNTNGRILANGSNAAFFDLTGDILMYQPQDIICGVDYDPVSGDFWFANNTLGLSHRTDADCVSYTINSPALNDVFRLSYSQDKLFATNGWRWATQAFNPPYVIMYQNGVWTNYLPQRLLAQMNGARLYDVLGVAADPADLDHFFLGSFGTGLTEWQGDSLLHHYNASNTPLHCATYNDQDYATYTRVDALLWDADNTLWMVNASIGLYALRDTAWMEFPIYSTNNVLVPFHTPGPIFKEKLNSHRIWIPYIRYNAGLGLLDYGSDITDQSDDRSIFRREFQIEGGLTTSFARIYESAEDYDGNIWFTTDDGLFYFPAEEDFFSSNIIRHLGIMEGDAEWFLKDQYVSSIIVDNHNRKWVGTNSLGLFVVSADNQRVLAHYTTTNSPLLSNCINTMAQNPVSGEIMIATGSGLVSCFFEEDVEPEGQGMPDGASAIEAIDAAQPCKQILDGRVVIIREGRSYDIFGRLIR